MEGESNKRKIEGECEKCHSKKQKRQLYVELKHPKARAPMRATEGSVGYDLYSCEDKTIPQGERCLVDTGVAVAVPGDTYGRIAPRSSMELKGIDLVDHNYIDVKAGVIDRDYRLPLKVILHNCSKSPYEVKVGDRIAQLILERCETPSVILTKLETNDRGGFGSTGRAELTVNKLQ